MDALDRRHAVHPREPHVHEDNLGFVLLDHVDCVFAASDSAKQFEVIRVAEQDLQALPDDLMVVHGKTASLGGHHSIVTRTPVFRWET